MAQSTKKRKSERSDMRSDLLKLAEYVPRSVPKLYPEGMFIHVQSLAESKIATSSYDDLRSIWDTQLPAILKSLPDTGDLDSLLSSSAFAAEYILDTFLGDTFAFKVDFTEPFESFLDVYNIYVYGVRQERDLNLADLILAKTSSISFLSAPMDEQKC